MDSSSLAATTIFTFHIFCFILIANAQKMGLRVELIHRDSPKSPFYNPNEDVYQRMTRAFQRSHAQPFHSNPKSLAEQKDPQSVIVPSGGAYLMNVFLGTPPVKILAIADTGSDLIWTQCEPCKYCYPQDDPKFNPQGSSTYAGLSCPSNRCGGYGSTQTRCGPANKCLYLVLYGSGYSTGDLAAETVGLASTSGSVVLFPRTIIGCGRNNNGTFTPKGSGIIGLGGGPLSLISQMGDSIAGKFSYCLVPHSSMSAGKSSIMNFGSSAVSSGSGVMSTPLVKKSPPEDIFYFLTLEAISVGTRRLQFSGSPSGNIIIDSGTTLTILPQAFYSELEQAVASQINAPPVADPSNTAKLCYSPSALTTVPSITVHFSGADVVLQRENAFAQLSPDAECFAFRGSSGSSSIYGNVAQRNFHVAYDTQSQTVSFMQTDCTKM